MNETKGREGHAVRRRNFFLNTTSHAQGNLDNLHDHFYDMHLADDPSQEWVPQRCAGSQGTLQINLHESMKKESPSRSILSQCPDNPSIVLRTPIKSITDIDPMHESLYDHHIDTADPSDQHNCFVFLSNVSPAVFHKFKLYLLAQIGDIIFSVQSSSGEYVLRFVSSQQAFQCSRLSGIHFEDTTVQIVRGLSAQDKQFLESRQLFPRIQTSPCAARGEARGNMIQWPIHTERLVQKIQWTVGRWRPLKSVDCNSFLT